MAISHICLGCGADLAGERASPEPHYGLWIVACPRCGRVAARRWTRVLWQRRRARRVRAALVALGSRMALLLLATAAVLVGAWYMTATLDEVGLGWEDLGGVVSGRIEWPAEDWALRGGPFVMGGWVLACLTAGAVLGAGLSHWRWWAAWGCWGALLLGLMWIKPAWARVDVAFHEMTDPLGTHGEPRAAMWGRLAAAALASWLATGLGVPLGRLIHRSHESAAARRWRRLLAKHRRRRLER